MRPLYGLKPLLEIACRDGLGCTVEAFLESSQLESARRFYDKAQLSTDERKLAQLGHHRARLLYESNPIDRRDLEEDFRNLASIPRHCRGFYALIEGFGRFFAEKTADLLPDKLGGLADEIRRTTDEAARFQLLQTAYSEFLNVEQGGGSDEVTDQATAISSGDSESWHKLYEINPADFLPAKFLFGKRPPSCLGMTALMVAFGHRAALPMLLAEPLHHGESLARKLEKDLAVPYWILTAKECARDQDQFGQNVDKFIFNSIGRSLIWTNFHTGIVFRLGEEQWVHFDPYAGYLGSLRETRQLSRIACRLDEQSATLPGRASLLHLETPNDEIIRNEQRERNKEKFDLALRKIAQVREIVWQYSDREDPPLGRKISLVEIVSSIVEAGVFDDILAEHARALNTELSSDEKVVAITATILDLDLKENKDNPDGLSEQRVFQALDKLLQLLLDEARDSCMLDINKLLKSGRATPSLIELSRPYFGLGLRVLTDLNCYIQQNGSGLGVDAGRLSAASSAQFALYHAARVDKNMIPVLRHLPVLHAAVAQAIKEVEARTKERRVALCAINRYRRCRSARFASA